MKAKELGEWLIWFSETNEEALVVIDGYEGGIEEVLTVEPTTVVLNCNRSKETLFGPHELEKNYRSDPDAGPSVLAIYLYGRQSRN